MCWTVRWKQKFDRCGFPPNNTFIRQCNLFSYHKYMPTHSPVCCQAPGMILMRNINGRCPEHLLVLVPITSRSMAAAILFHFCGRWLDQPFNVCCAVANYSNWTGSSKPEKLRRWFDVTDKVDQSFFFNIAVRLTWSLLRLIHLSPQKDIFPSFCWFFFFKFPVFSWPGSLFFLNSRLSR